MGQHDSKGVQSGIDFEQLAEGIDEFRETMRALVAGLVSDGFTEREARALVAGVFGGNIYKDVSGNEEGSA